MFGSFLDRVMPDLGPAAAAGIDRAYAERDLRALRLARGDVIAMAQAATVAERRELDATLRAEAGVSLDDLSARDVQRIARIRARGRLTSEEQYYLVRERVDYIAGRPDRADEYGELPKLLHEYAARLPPGGGKPVGRAA